MTTAETEDLPVPTDADIQRGIELADELTDQLVDDIVADSEDLSGVAYSVWINLTHLLADNGWTADELVQDVRRHAAREADTIGRPAGSA